MKIMVMDRKDVQVVDMFSPHIFISIQDPNNRKTFPGVGRNSSTLDVLEVNVHDTTRADNIPRILMGIPEDQEVIVFGQQEAIDVLNFVAKYADQAEYLIVHCDAGFSRSPAVAAAISKIYNGEDHEYFKRYSPNQKVYSEILRAFYLGLDEDAE